MPIPVSAIDKFVKEEGEQVRHLVGIRCYCHGPDGQADPNCPDHEAGGWLFAAEEMVTGLVTDISQNRELMETGVFMPGDCIFSPLTEHQITEGDKIIFTWALPHGQGDVLVRGIGASDELYYEAIAGLLCIDQDKVFYKYGIDYRFDGKRVVWAWDGKSISGKQPAPGKQYTVKYTAYIEWIVFVPPVERINSGENLGSKVMLRKKHLLESK